MTSTKAKNFYLHANNGVDEEEHCNEETHIRQRPEEKEKAVLMTANAYISQ